MADEVILNTGDAGKLAAVTIALGDVITLGAAGKWVKTADLDATWAVALGPAAADERVTAVKETEMKVLVDATAAIAVGDELYIGDGKLYNVATGRVAAGVRAGEALASGTGLITVWGA